MSFKEKERKGKETDRRETELKGKGGIEEKRDKMRNGRKKKEPAKRTPTKPMLIHLPRIPLDLETLRTPLDDFKRLPRHDDVGRVGAAGPFLTVGAVAEGRDGGVARVGVFDCGAEAGAFCHFFFWFGVWGFCGEGGREGGGGLFAGEGGVGVSGWVGEFVSG